jgi:hypothetical protein
MTTRTAFNGAFLLDFYLSHSYLRNGLDPFWISLLSALFIHMSRFLSQVSSEASEMTEYSFLHGQVFPDSFRATALSSLFHLIPLCIIR